MTISKPYNKKQAITAFVNKYPRKFEMKEDAIDLREMAENYENGIIPLEDIRQAILTVVGPKYQHLQIPPHDPKAIINPQFGYVSWDECYLWPIFQRDVAPNHVEKIFKGFDPTCIIVPCAIKLTLKNGKTVYCIWDGHHTMQVCKMRNYTMFPTWYIDIDHIPLTVIENAGFGDTDEDRIRFGAWLAGTNMRNINGKMKRPLSPYDDFMIGIETRDQQYVSMKNILTKHGCVPKRNASCAGAFTQIKSGIECYELEDSNGNQGTFWDRALQFHVTNWKMSHLVLEMFRPMTYLYHHAHLEGFKLPSQFDEELAALLIDRWGDAESIQEGIKVSYNAALSVGQVTGQIPDHDKVRVLNGIINYYNQSKGKVITRRDGSTITISGFLLPLPTCQWKV
jgi:hypothetical protein